jgi:glycosyltransferase involved in cell wall biosynthesis
VLPRPANEGIPDLTVAIPTINSDRYLDIILKFYRDNGIPTVVFVDDRSNDGTLETARRWGNETISITNGGTFIAEGMVEGLSRHCPTKWVLRIDDDELPTLALVSFVRELIAGGGNAVWGFPRHQCAVSPTGRLLVAPTISSLEHRQWRLYQPDKVHFISGLHTPGFQWREEPAEAPLEAALIHLDWAVHSYEERRHKMERYDAHTPNQGTRWRSFYLYEEEPGGGPFSELGLPEFQEVGVQIAARFPKLCVEPTREQSLVSESRTSIST